MKKSKKAARADKVLALIGLYILKRQLIARLLKYTEDIYGESKSLFEHEKCKTLYGGPFHPFI